MPSLSSMRSLDPAGDSTQPLGPPVREVREVPPPAPKPTGTPGVFQQPDGKLATDLPLPPHHRPTELGEPLVPSPGPAWFTQEYQLQPATEPRQVKVGDWVRILSGQRGIDKINAMVGGVFQVTRVNSGAITVNTWTFNLPDSRHHDGQLWTEFAEAPR